MTDEQGSFSRRYGFRGRPSEPLMYHDAPEKVRVGLLSILQGEMEISPSWMREVVSGVLRIRPNPGNWSEYPNIWDEVEGLIHHAEWYEVYDIIEGFAGRFARKRRLDEYSAHLNELLADEGIGWRLNGTSIEVHGDEALEGVVGDTEEELEESGFSTAATELSEARRDLSRRPHPDLSGAIQHAMAALECVAREVTGDSRATLGQIISRHPDLFPRPVDEAAARLWGYASEQARHGREDRCLEWEETLLVVGVAGSLCSYLNAKSRDM